MDRVNLIHGLWRSRILKRCIVRLCFWLSWGSSSHSLWPFPAILAASDELPRTVSRK
jgi:hypothetical protein